jgi:hypothetical protein
MKTALLTVYNHIETKISTTERKSSGLLCPALAVAAPAAAAICAALCRATNILSTLNATLFLGVHLLSLSVAAAGGVAASFLAAQPAHNVLLDLHCQGLPGLTVEMVDVRHDGLGLLQRGCRPQASQWVYLYICVL